MRMQFVLNSPDRSCVYVDSSQIQAFSNVRSLNGDETSVGIYLNGNGFLDVLQVGEAVIRLMKLKFRDPDNDET